MEDDNNILVIRAGGTIDAEPYPDPHHPPEFVDVLVGSDSLIKRTLYETLKRRDVDVLHWGGWNESRFDKDSQKFSPEDIEALARVIKEQKHRYIVVTHGTDAMMKNAAALQAELEGTDKTILFVGAMVPLSMHQKFESDGVDNLRFSLDHIRELPAGVRVLARDIGTQRLTMFPPNGAQKNTEVSRRYLRTMFRPVKLQDGEPPVRPAHARG